MSWNAYLSAVTRHSICGSCGHQLDVPLLTEYEVESWNYKHNTSCMIYNVLEKAGYTLSGDQTWWKHLNGMEGKEGREYLRLIVRGLENHPAICIAMNPSNGWGSYEGLLKILREMRDAVDDEYEYVWSANG